MQMQMQMEHQLHMNGMKMEKFEGRKWRRGEKGWLRGIEWEMEMMGGKGDDDEEDEDDERKGYEGRI